MATHQLKTWSHYFEEVLSEAKTHEFRKNDRNFQVGDLLILEEWDPKTEKYTGRAVGAKITHVLRISELDGSLKTQMNLNPCPGSLNQMAILSIKLTRMRVREGSIQEGSC
jgi:hypothetical protein